MLHQPHHREPTPSHTNPSPAAHLGPGPRACMKQTSAAAAVDGCLPHILTWPQRLRQLLPLPTDQAQTQTPLLRLRAELQAGTAQTQAALAAASHTPAASHVTLTRHQLRPVSQPHVSSHNRTAQELHPHTTTPPCPPSSHHRLPTADDGVSCLPPGQLV
jgi:hypothetical protein